MASTQRLNTGRNAEFADQANGGNNGLVLDFTEIEYTGGIQGISSGTYVDVTGVQIAFNLTVPGVVQFFALATGLSNPFVQGNYIGLAINVNGTDYPLGGPGGQAFNAAGGGQLVSSGFTSGSAQSPSLVLSLAAGAYTVKLRALGSGYIESSTNFPSKLTAVYPVVTGDIAAASPLTKQEVEDTTSGTLTNGAATGTYADLGVTTINFNLNSPQVVLFEGQAYGFNAAGFEINVQLGLNVDGVDYHGGQAGSQNLGLGLSVGLVVTKAILLGAGAHTAKLRFRRYDGSAPSARVSVSATNPARLTAIYTEPQAIAPVPFSKFATAVRTSGDILAVSTTSLIDVPGPVEVTINDHTGGDVIIEVSANASGGSGNHIIGLGLKIDGIEQSDTPDSQRVGINPMGCLGATVVGFVGFKWVASGLSPGTHTFRLTHAVDGGSTANLRSTPQRPIRMMVWYN